MGGSTWNIRDGLSTRLREPEEITTSTRHRSLFKRGNRMRFVSAAVSRSPLETLMTRDRSSTALSGRFIFSRSVRIVALFVFWRMAMRIMQCSPVYRMLKSRASTLAAFADICAYCSAVTSCPSKYWRTLCSASLNIAVGVMWSIGTHALTSSGIVGAKNVVASIPCGTWVGSLGGLLAALPNALVLVLICSDICC